MKKFDQLFFFECITYVILWLLVMIFPVANELVDMARGVVFEWDFVLRYWRSLIPFFVLFVIHNFIIVRVFHAGSRTWLYLLSLLVIVSLFALYQGFSFPQHRKEFEVGLEYKKPISDEDVMFYKAPPGHEERFLQEPNPPRQGPPHRAILPVPVLMNVLLAVLMLGFNLAIVLMFRYHMEIDKKKEVEKMQLQDELRYLKAQISPHFFMNMLNNIHAMVDVDSERAQEMIIDLSKLMRYVLYDGEGSKTNLNEEVTFIRNYVSLMSQRYSKDKVDIVLELPEESVSERYLPPLLFITFIENAFKHGISYKHKSSVYISITVEGNQISLVCRNTKYPTDKVATKGVGQENAKRRLNLIYGSDYSLVIDESDDLYNVNLIIPSL